MKNEFKTPDQIKADKLQKKYPNAKVIDKGSYANLPKKERIKSKINKIENLRGLNKLGGSQLLRFDKAKSRYVEQSDKVEVEIKKISEKLGFWMDKRIELMEECLDIQLEILNEKIIK